MTPFLLFAGLGAWGLRAPWLWTLFAAAAWGAAWASPPRRRLPAAALWAATLAWGLLSALASAEPFVSLAAFAYAATAFLWLALGATRSTAEERLWGERLLWAAGLLLAAAALLVEVPGYRGVGLLYPYYNYTAAVVAAAGAAAVAAWAAGRGALGLAGGAAAAVFLAQAGSRGGLAALAAATAWALWRSGRRSLLALAGTLAAAALLLPSAPRDLLLKAARPGAHARPAIWRAALEVAADRPWLGEGPGRFARGFLRHQFPLPPAMNLPRYALRADRAHSEVFGAVAEMGFPGAVLVLAALALAWLDGPRAREPGRDALSAAAVALGVQAMGDSIFALPALGWLFAWCFGAACAPAEDGTPVLAAPARRAALSAGLALASFAWWPDWAVGAWAERFPAAALRVAPYDPWLWESLARRRLADGEDRAALLALDRDSQLAPYDAVPLVMAAEVARARGDWRVARVLADKALALEPGCGQALLLRAEAAWRLEGRAAAMRAVDRLRASQARPLDAVVDLPRVRLLVGYDRARLATLEAQLAGGT